MTAIRKKEKSVRSRTIIKLNRSKSRSRQKRKEKICGKKSKTKNTTKNDEGGM